MNKSTLIITGADEVSQKLLGEEANFLAQFSLIALDYSNSPKRILRLLFKGRINIFWLIKVFIGQFFQMHELKNIKPILADHKIYSNADLIRILEENKNITRVITFRAGLLINQKVINLRRCFNIHCASLPKYSGLGAISQALHNGDLNQMATFHVMEVKIDSGKVIKTIPYTLSPQFPLWQNELVAYKTGVRLLKSVVAE